jgi:hypothetical protein
MPNLSHHSASGGGKPSPGKSRILILTFAILALPVASKCQHSTPATTYCGLFDATGALATYGGCSRMDVDEASQIVACANQTNHNEIDTNLASPLQRTMVISFTGTTGNGVITANPTAIFNQAVEALGGTVATSGVVIAAQ